MKYRKFRTVTLLILIVAVILSLMPESIDTGFSKAKAEGTEVKAEEITVAGLPLLTNTPYTVYLEPSLSGSPSFSPITVVMEFKSATYCILTYNGQSVKMGRFDNKKVLDLFSLSSEMSEQLVIDGTCDTNCTNADFAVRVTTYIQGENAIHLFSDNAVIPEIWTTTPKPIEPETLVTFRAGNLTLSQGVRYKVLITPDDSCDKIFEPFVKVIEFKSDLSAWFISQYKNVSSAYPVSLYREDSGWIELSSNSGSVWGIILPGTDGTDLIFSVTGLEKNLGSMFTITGMRKKTEPIPAPKPVVPSVEYDPLVYFYCGILNEKEKTVYKQLVYALENCEDTVELANPVSNEDLNRIFWYVLYDQPQIFWTNRRYYGSLSDGLVTTVKLYYNDLADNLSQEKKRVDTVVEKIVKATKGMSATESERYVHDYLVTHTTYVAGSPNNQNLYSTLVSEKTVCAGYARAFQYIMQCIGIPCYYCRGTTPDGDGGIGYHAWNLIKLSDGWYNVDVTWDDQYREKDREYSYIYYKYYNVTDSFISADHTRDENSERLPKCTSYGASFERLYGHDWRTEINNKGWHQ